MKNTNPNLDKATDPAAIMQQNRVNGTVTDKNGPIPGANVVVTGTTQGVVTDIAGKYSIEVPQGAKSLTFSFIGMESQEISIGTLTQINVTMAESAIGLEEVVVIGYGTQKKVNLTGSVSSVSGEQLSRKIVTQTSQLLQGATTGLTATQGSGKPGADQASLKIRGLGTWSGAGTDPLVIIDGIQGSINSVNPNNIESISVLKDAASSAIYGSRAANGVILITTKEGIKGEMKVSYDAYIGKQEATALPQYVDSWTYAEMLNEAAKNADQQIAYTDEEIAKYKSGVDPDNYPNKHHLKDLFNSGNGLQTKHNLTFSGGNEDILYLFSAGYLEQSGLVKKNSYDRYDVQLNLSSKLRNNLKLSVKLLENKSTSNEPAGISNNGAATSGLDEVVRAANHYNATIPGKRSDGTYGVSMGHPVADAFLASNSFGETINTSSINNISLDWDITKSLKFTNRISYQWYNTKDRLFGSEFKCSDAWTFGPTQAQITVSNYSDLINESLINYDLTKGKHYLHVLGGFAAEKHDIHSLTGFRDNFPNNQLYILSAGSITNDSNYESETTWKMVSYFGRVNYSYQDKYLLEGNLRYDGSSRFARGYRFGLFPSISAGWRISEEDFFKIPWISNLKLRLSYGILGNQQIGNYPYQRILSLGSIYVTGETEKTHSAVQLTNLPFQDISWETTKVTNAGIDIGFFEGKLNFTADHYYKLTKDILYPLSVSKVLGMSVGQQNAGSLLNKGWEFELKYNNSIGDFSYSIHPNFSVNHNEVKSLAGVKYDISKGLFIGESLNSIYGYESDGLFVDQADINSWPTQNYTAKPGYPRFKDISGPDGVPDGIISSTYDRKIIGSEFPKYSYGMDITAGYKGFEFSMQLQGLGGYQTLIQGDEQAFNNNGNIQQWQVDNRWTQENPDRNAKYPRLEPVYHEIPWEVNLDYWLRDGSFLRLKNIQMGYNLSKYFKNTFIDQFRIYVHGENLAAFNHYYPGWDPEMVTTGTTSVSYYPIARTWSLGINVQF